MPHLSRRLLLQASGLSLLGMATAPTFLARAAQQVPGGGRRVLVTLFLRGGADGLSLVAPVGDADYNRLRPTIALRATGERAALRLDDTFWLHPGLAALMPQWSDGTLAVVHAVGLPQAMRSHFDAQDFIETGTPGVKSTREGYLNRALEQLPPEPASAFRAVAMQDTLPRALAGTAPALALETLADFRLRDPQRGATFASLYAGAVDEALRTTGAEASAALARVRDEGLADMPPAHGATYPRSPLGKRMQDIARLIRADVGLQVAATEMGGWDTHMAQGITTGHFASRARELGEALGAFVQDLGPRWSDVLVVVMTEFGRTVKENGSRGTDHGTGSAMLVLGGGVRGGRVVGPWKGLAAEHLLEERDVPSLTDFRTVLSEALEGHLGVRSLASVFPGFQPRPEDRLGLLRG
ncbi:hypothetical protein CYFUS_005102 [Cystobacter fuscus]|uniref:Transcriptional initiation protein Tat n=1 Tax=Cystobacter fuscus TaxID=43 RepID=A0A250J802_9BACT|nr:DUF1501 domain-containing protein [Cystobacter fuscus]ATB39657.1 hypothetical protein CYFUS_005102 [Cystobacter fuscus]